MYITKIEKDNKKYKIYVDEQFLFCLYYTEIKKYGLKLDEEVTVDLIERIGSEVILKRGVTYIYHLLSKKDYTSLEILKKLLQAGYIESYAQQILSKVIGQGFVDDADYAKRYIDQMHTRKSKRQIMYTLQGKGVSQEVLNELYEAAEVDEYEAARRIIQKKLRNALSLTYEERAKLYTYMANKGFGSSTIHKVIAEALELFSEL